MSKVKKASYLVFCMVFITGLFPPLTAVNARSGATITVNPQTIVNPDFLGIGAEYDPFHFMPESVASGYNDNWWEVEKRRLAKLQPDMVRVWYQMDWMEPTNDNNDPNVINWSGMQTNSVKMQSLYRVLDYLQEQDIDVMLVAGWKMNAQVQSWLGFGGLAKPETSAPTDLAEWAEWVSASLQQLIVNKGYTNIKYVQSYNEPNLGDFETPAHIDQKSYYEAMYRAIHNRLVADGLRHLIKLGGPDESSGLDWVQYAADNMDDILDIYQGHAYGYNYDTLASWVSSRFNHIGSTGKPLLITEFAAPGDKTTYQNGVDMADLIISGMRNNVSSMLLWRMADQYLVDPLNFLDSSSYGTWVWLPESAVPRYTYYSLSLFTRFGGKHSQVLGTSSNDPDLHVSSLKRPDGNYSVFVVNKHATSSKEVTIQFGGTAINKSFRRHLYASTLEPTANATILPSDKAWTNVASSLTDTLLPPNSVAVYTTVSEPVQIETLPSEVSVARGASIPFSSQMRGANHSVQWSVQGGSAYGSINSSGVYTAPLTIPPMRQAIVRAQSSANPNDYDLAVVRFRVEGVTARGRDGQVLLEWEPSVGATGYRVKRSSSMSGPFTTVANHVTATSYTDTGLVNGATYYYTVSAVNGNGEADPSLVLSSIPTSNTLQDDFGTGTIDQNKWTLIHKGLRSNSPTGIAANEANGVLSFTGTTSVSFWGGRTLQSKMPFHATASEPLVVEVDRVSMSGSGTGVRSALWLYVNDSYNIHFSQNQDTGVWAYNLNGGSDTLLFPDTGYGNRKMKLVHDGSHVHMYVDDVLRASVAVSWSADMFVMLTGGARASGDSISVAFDNLNVGPQSPASNELLEDSFSTSAIDSARWATIDRGLRSNAPTGINAAQGNGVLNISGTTSVNYWGGKTLQSISAFNASQASPLVVEVDRVSLAGTGTGARSALWLYTGSNQYIRLSQNTDTGVWAYNLNGGSDVLVWADNDYGNHRMKLVHDGSSVQLYVDDVMHANVPVAWNSNMQVMLTGEARANGDSVTAVFDNLLVSRPGAVVVEDIILDNPDAEMIGTWTLGGGLPNFYGNNYAVNPSGTGADKVRWRPTLPVSGAYAVYYWLPDGNADRATNAPFTVYYHGGSQTFAINQQVSPGGEWKLLGSFNFLQGTSGYVELTDNANSNYVIADAVKFVKVN